MSAEFDALAASVLRLRDIVGRLVPDDLDVSAFPSEWTVADTLSHLGSAAVITVARMDASLSGTELSTNDIHAVWDEWNAKESQQQAGDALMADEALLDRFRDLTDGERARIRVPMGPLMFGFDMLLRSRMAEHAIHVWDIEIAFDSAATVEQQSVDLIVDELGPIAGWGGRPDGVARSVTVRTENPGRDYVISTDAERVALTPGQPTDEADLVVPAEAFVRLVYGRLPEELVPDSVVGVAHVADLRTIFRGI